MFEVGADAYDQFMGRFSVRLASPMADLADVRARQRALDVGCGPGALTTELVRRLGPAAVAAVDPSASFVAAAQGRHPGVDVRQAGAEALPFADHIFDRTLAQLVVHFLRDPVRGLREMARVTRPGGVVAACVWDHAGGRGPLGLFWEVARQLDPLVTDEGDLPGSREGHLVELFEAAGLQDVRGTSLDADLEVPDFAAWWAPFALATGPAGAYVAGLGPDRRAALEAGLRARLPEGPFTVPARAWAARGTAVGSRPGSARRPFADT